MILWRYTFLVISGTPFDSDRIALYRNIVSSDNDFGRAAASAADRK
jgi:hypothetical protein